MFMITLMSLALGVVLGNNELRSGVLKMLGMLFGETELDWCEESLYKDTAGTASEQLEDGVYTTWMPAAGKRDVRVWSGVKLANALAAGLVETAVAGVAAGERYEPAGKSLTAAA